MRNISILLLTLCMAAVTLNVQAQNVLPQTVQAPYYCDTPIIVTRNANDALSVRCVKVNVWPE